MVRAAASLLGARCYLRLCWGHKGTQGFKVSNRDFTEQKCVILNLWFLYLWEQTAHRQTVWRGQWAVEHWDKLWRYQQSHQAVLGLLHTLTAGEANPPMGAHVLPSCRGNVNLICLRFKMTKSLWCVTFRNCVSILLGSRPLVSGWFAVLSRLPPSQGAVMYLHCSSKSDPGSLRVGRLWFFREIAN